jgi:hypothetical protein
LLIDTSQNRLQGFKQLVIFSHLNPFEFFFHCKKQAEVTGGQISWRHRCHMWGMPCSSSQSVEARLMSTEQLSRWTTSHFWCGALPRGKIVCSNGMNIIIIK